MKNTDKPLMIMSAELEYKPGTLIRCALTDNLFKIPESPTFYLDKSTVKVRGYSFHVYSPVYDRWAKVVGSMDPNRGLSTDITVEDNFNDCL